MLWLGIGLVLFNMVARGYFMPAEHSLGGDPSNYPRLFYSPVSRWAYLLLEKLTRWIGCILVVGAILGFQGGVLKLLAGGLAAGLLAGLLIPMLSLMLALKIHPGFKRQLD